MWFLFLIMKIPQQGWSLKKLWKEHNSSMSDIPKKVLIKSDFNVRIKYNNIRMI